MGSAALVVPGVGVAVQDRVGLRDKVDRNVPTGLDVHVVLDNLATHKTPKVHKWLLRHPRFHFHFTPTYGSWMNLVERWFLGLDHQEARTLRAQQRQRARSISDADVEAVIVRTLGGAPGGQT